jgi:hypothetical protein
LKVNTPVRITRQRRVPKAATNILKDEIGHLPSRLGNHRRNPFSAPIRLVTVQISTGRVLTLVTNDLKAPASEIAVLYKSRWEIELFFKWMKQNLSLTCWSGSRNSWAGPASPLRRYFDSRPSHSSNAGHSADCPARHPGKSLNPPLNSHSNSLMPNPDNSGLDPGMTMSFDMTM